MFLILFKRIKTFFQNNKKAAKKNVYSQNDRTIVDGEFEEIQ